MSAKVLSYLNPNIEFYDNWGEFEEERTLHKNISIHELANKGYVDELKNAVQLLLEQTDYKCLEDGSLEESFNLKNDNGDSPLMEAVSHGHYEMAETLVLNGADVNLKCAQGISPLEKALEMHNDKVIKLLVDHGAI